MKITELNVETNFKPIKLTITIENENDLMFLWLATNLGGRHLSKAYEMEEHNLTRVRNLIFGENMIKDKSRLWKILDQHMKRLGL